MNTFFVDVILPLHIHGTYTYRVPQEYNDVIKAGQRVVVQFGPKRLYSAVVRRVHEECPRYTVKYVLSILDINPIVDEHQFRFWEWIADYYMSYVGDVMAVALPTAFKLASESSVSIHPDYSGELNDLTANELRVVQLLADHPVMTVEDISRAIGLQKMMPLLNTMMEREIIVMNEELRQRFTPRTSTYLTLAPDYQNAERCRELFDTLEKKRSTHKQLETLMHFMQLSQMGKEAVAKRKLLEADGGEKVSAASLRTLLKNGVLLQEERIESRLMEYDSLVSAESIQLNDEQQAVVDYMHQTEKAVTLLHGVTSSGKKWV